MIPRGHPLQKTYQPNRCHSHADGDCFWEDCPQLKDGEPAKSGRHCPLDDSNDFLHNASQINDLGRISVPSHESSHETVAALRKWARDKPMPIALRAKIIARSLEVGTEHPADLRLLAARVAELASLVGREKHEVGAWSCNLPPGHPGPCQPGRWPSWQLVLYMLTFGWLPRYKDHSR